MIPTSVTNFSFVPNHFETAQISCLWREAEYCWYGITGFEVKVNYGTLPKNRSGHDACYSLCPITLKVHTHVVMIRTRNHIDFRTWHYRSRSAMVLCLWNLIVPIQIVFMCRPEWFGPAFTICNWIVRPSFCLFIYPFVRYFLTLTSLVWVVTHQPDFNCNSS